MRILLTGGAGFIGSHTAVLLLEAGYEAVIADNFSNSKPEVIERIGRITGRPVVSREVDLRDLEALRALFADFAFDAVIHFAGYKAVGESVAEPLKYYENNLNATLNLLAVMREYDVKSLIFSSSATVYRSDNAVPYREDDPLGAVNPYGWTKFMIEQMLRDLAAADASWRIVLLRYFNPIGAHPSGLIGEAPQGVPNNLVPYVARVASGEYPFVRVFGDDYDTPDGTGVRDYIHVMDLARGHLLAMEYVRDRRGAFAFNLGRGRGYSVMEVIAAYSKVCGRELPYEILPRRAGDLATVYADVSRAREGLGFTCELDLEAMCRDSWRWQSAGQEDA